MACDSKNQQASGQCMPSCKVDDLVGAHQGGSPAEQMKNKMKGAGVVDLHGYQRKEQNLFYRPTSTDYGLKPAACNLPVCYHPRNSSFTDNLTGNYEDAHFTTRIHD